MKIRTSRSECPPDCFLIESKTRESCTEPELSLCTLRSQLSQLAPETPGAELGWTGSGLPQAESILSLWIILEM